MVETLTPVWRATADQLSPRLTRRISTAAWNAWTSNRPDMALSLLDHRQPRRPLGLGQHVTGDLQGGLARQVHEALGILRIGARDHDRYAGVAAEPDPRVDRDLAEELGA